MAAVERVRITHSAFLVGAIVLCASVTAVAAVKVNAGKLPAATLADSSKLKVG